MGKKHVVFWLVVLAFGAIITGCIEETDSSLFESGPPELVIEGEINNGEPPYYIRISRSVDPESYLDFVPVSIAKVTIENNLGEVELLRPVSPGLYRASSIKGAEGVFYSLKVDVDNQLYTANDTMPQAPKVDTVLVTYKDEYPYVEGYYLSVQTQVLKNRRNYYRLRISVNDSLFNAYSDLIVFEDLNESGIQLVTLPYVFGENDTVQVTLNAITKVMYDYYNGLLKQTTNYFSNIQPPLVNPPSNISCNPLGYFQVTADTTIQVVVK
jgi:hypothetical protein